MQPLNLPRLLVVVLNLVWAIVAYHTSLPNLVTSSNYSMTSRSLAIEWWAEHARQGPGRANQMQQRAISTLQSVFQGSVAPGAAATRIASTYSTSLRRELTLSPIFEFWGMICEAVQSLGGFQAIDERLIEMLNEISRLPDLTDKSGRPIGPGSGVSGVFWKDLPGLAVMFREYAIDIEPGTPEMPDPGDWTDAQRATLMNLVTFGALYLNHGRIDIGMPFHAEVTLMEGIEVPYQTPEQQRAAVTDVPPAATWILLAGSKIYGLCQTGTVKKGRGYDLGRWAFWKRKFGEIAVNGGLTADVRDIAAKAASKMSLIEG